jgi:hypothetical protein
VSAHCCCCCAAAAASPHTSLAASCLRLPGSATFCD